MKNIQRNRILAKKPTWLIITCKFNYIEPSLVTEGFFVEKNLGFKKPAFSIMMLPEPLGSHYILDVAPHSALLYGLHIDQAEDPAGQLGLGLSF